MRAVQGDSAALIGDDVGAISGDLNPKALP